MFQLLVEVSEGLRGEEFPPLLHHLPISEDFLHHFLQHRTFSFQLELGLLFQDCWSNYFRKFVQNLKILEGQVLLAQGHTAEDDGLQLGNVLGHAHRVELLHQSQALPDGREELTVVLLQVLLVYAD